MNDLLKDLPQEQRDIMKAYATIQERNEYITMLSTQYVLASVQQNSAKEKECAKLMLECARVMLDACEQLAKVS